MPIYSIVGYIHTHTHIFPQCSITRSSLTREFSELAIEKALTSPEGDLCVIEEEHHHEGTISHVTHFDLELLD